MLKTIKSKFIFISVIFITLSVGIPIHFLVKQFRENFKQRSELLLTTTLDMIAYGLENAMMLGGKDVQKIVEDISKQSNVNHIRMFASDGEILYSSNPEEVGKKMEAEAPGHIPTKISEITRRELKLVDDNHAYTAIEPIRNSPKCASCHGAEPIIAYLDVDSHITLAEKRFFTGSFHIIFLGFAIIIVLILGFVYLFNRFVNRHIRAFVKAMGKVQNGDLNVQLPARRDDEVSNINKQFNGMVSELKTSREELEALHMEQLRHANKLAIVGSLTAEVAHEINNYSGIIFSRSDYLLLNSNDKGELSNYKDDLQVIQNQIQKISGITGNILRHSKRLPKEFTRIDLVSIASSSSQILETLLVKRNIDIIKNFEIDSAIINGDAQQIEELIINLINNAADAIPSERDKGIISVVVKDFDQKYFELSIADNGAGIKEEDKPHLFSPFFTTKDKEKGTGLGLYIAHNICKNHNATIDCDSRIGEGSKFIIIFPKKNN